MQVCSVLVCVFKLFSETTGPTETKFHVEPQWDRGDENLFKGFRSFVVLHLNIVSLWGRGLFTGLLPQMWPFSWALEIEKLKSPLFWGPKGAGDTNDWCITASGNLF